MSLKSFINRDKQRGTAAHRRAPKQEKALALRFAGKQVPGSGSRDQKGDVMKARGFIRIEAKTTRNESFRVTKEILQRIEDAALPNNEIPALVVEFLDQTGKPCGEVAIVPVYALEFLER